ncbi:hypothetical protein ACIA3Y_05010 [Lactobacillus delbrueckii subsp. bulgaricus]
MIGAAQGQKMQTFFGINAGSAVALIAYVGQIFTLLESIGMEIQSIQDAMAGMSRIQDFLNEADSKPDIYQGEGDYITFDHVTFGYLPDQPILKDYCFKVAKGEHVTFVGRTGKGFLNFSWASTSRKKGRSCWMAVRQTLIPRISATS